MMLRTFACLALTFVVVNAVRAELVTGGTANIALYDTPTNAAFADRFFTGTDAAGLTRTELLDVAGSPAVGFERAPTGVDLSINDAAPVQPTGRARQATTLDFDSSATDVASFLASWDAATPGFGAFGPNLTDGEQIGIDGVLRFNSGLGVGVIGELALQYDPTATFGEGLTLTQNMDANAVIWQLDIDDATLVISDSGFSFEAEMQTAAIPAGFYGLDTNAGRFSISTITAVPEPSSFVSIALISVGGVLIRRRRRIVSGSRSNTRSN
ncbi:PEP-CTERM sorting domain-containing protein [Roseiconus lacunae]|uniref:PEP-CTERM sorting domain-containing protein n=1 Tax=Roseiconus lacunae TaxID=2605694 RepID=UPI0011F3A2AC